MWCSYTVNSNKKHRDVLEMKSLSRRIDNWELDREKKAEVRMPFGLFRRASSALRDTAL